jgi:hypothetical protein
MANRFVDLAKFLVTQRVLGFPVPDSPHFEGAGNEYFVNRLRQSSSYLEYGCGGSTAEAARQGKSFVSVESDPFYLAAVKKKIDGLPHHGRFIHADIGLTLEWGAPAFTSLNPDRVRRWSTYSTAPWETMTPAQFPDFILVDGRFRVACVLETVRRLAGRDFEILFDDYVGRPSYVTVERFARLDRMVGRMAVFKPGNYDAAELQTALSAAQQDFR